MILGLNLYISQLIIFTVAIQIPHSEDYPLALLNKYAESKRAGELNALKTPIINLEPILQAKEEIYCAPLSEWLIDSIINASL